MFVHRVGSLYSRPRFPDVGAAAPLAVAPEQLDALAADSERVLDEAIGELATFWEARPLPEVKTALAAWDEFDLGRASDAALAEHLDETWARALRAWELHFLVVVPQMLAIVRFEDLVAELLGRAGDPFGVHRLLQGYPSKTTDADRALWLAAQAPPAEREAELERYLAEYGAKSDGLMTPSVESWRENPEPARAALELLQGEPDPAGRQADLAIERERALAELRARLEDVPPEARDHCERLLAAATVAIRLHEDHHFWIDASVTYAVRRVLVEAGRRLAADAVISHAGDVFHLTLAELRGALVASVPQHDAVGERRAEIEQLASVEQPPFLGAPPQEPSDDPFTRMMVRVFGAPVEQLAEPAVVQGNPGSPGTARGRARVLASLDGAARLGPGDVLVAPLTTPPWTPLFARAAAIVTDMGGVLSHTAVVAREYRIPAVVGTGIATTVIPDGALVEVDGVAGTVRIVS